MNMITKCTVTYNSQRNYFIEDDEKEIRCDNSKII